MIASLLLLTAACAIASAADTTSIDILILGDKQPLVGSVINVDSQATTVAIKCKPDTPSESCGLPTEGATILQGPSTWRWTYSFSNKDAGLYTQDANCKLDAPKNEATCQVLVTQEMGGQRTTQSTSTVQTSYKSLQNPVAITAGAEKLTAAPGATRTSDATPSSAAGTSNPTKSNAAGPAASKNTLLAGAIAIIGGALML